LPERISRPETAGAATNVAHVDATAGEGVMGRLESENGSPPTPSPVRRSLKPRARTMIDARHGEDETDDAQPSSGSGVIVEPPHQSLVDRTPGPVDVRGGRG